jgi:mono/diheme cytochrome c family protein
MAGFRTSWLLGFGLCLALLIGGGLYFLARGFSARIPPSALEAFVARRLRLLAIPRDAREARSPVTPDAAVMSAAMAHFADHCAVCHANDGSGDTDFGRGLYPRPPDMRLPDTQNLTDGELYYITRNGIRFTGMPAFGDPANDPDEDTWGLVHFIRHLPELTADELARMGEMNPKSPMEMRLEEEIERFLRGEDVQPSETHQH